MYLPMFCNIISHEMPQLTRQSLTWSFPEVIRHPSDGHAPLVSPGYHGVHDGGKVGGYSKKKFIIGTVKLPTILNHNKPITFHKTRS